METSSLTTLTATEEIIQSITEGWMKETDPMLPSDFVEGDTPMPEIWSEEDIALHNQWNKEEDDKLIQLLMEGLSYDAIGVITFRTPRCVKSRTLVLIGSYSKNKYHFVNRDSVTKFNSELQQFLLSRKELAS